MARLDPQSRPIFWPWIITSKQKHSLNWTVRELTYSVLVLMFLNGRKDYIEIEAISRNPLPKFLITGSHYYTTYKRYLEIPWTEALKLFREIIPE